MDINQLTLSGYLTNAAEVVDGEVKFNTCCEVWQGGQGGQTEPMAIFCVYRSKNAAKVAGWLKPNRQVVLTGKLKPLGSSFYMEVGNLKMYGSKWQEGSSPVQRQGSYSTWTNTSRNDEF